MTDDPRSLVDRLRDRGYGPQPSANGHDHRQIPSKGDSYEGGDHPAATHQTEPPVPILTLGELVEAHPTLRPPLIEGLLRQGETMNIIAAPKIGKSWLVYGLAISLATGRPWLNTYATTRGNVLIVDNELHRETISKRLPRVAEAMDIDFAAIKDRVSVLSLRGRLQDLHQLSTRLLEIERDRYTLIIIDAWYRIIPAGQDENDNGGMARLYDRIDHIADTIGSSFCNIHHTSKGNQSEKAVTDVGSGAGSQSRATDTHLILRSHEDMDVVVLDAAVRSWPPVSPVCLKWAFPIWTPAPDLDPAALRQTRQRKRGTEGKESGKEKPRPWTAQRFAATYGRIEPQLRGAVIEAAVQDGLSERQACELLKRAVECRHVYTWRAAGQANRMFVSTVAPPEPAPPAEPTSKRSKRRRKK